MLAAGVVVGLALGTVFFGGLWLTTKRMNQAHHVFQLVLGSFLFRSAVSLAGLFLVIRFAGFSGVIGALVGFAIMQLVFLRRIMKRTTPR